jgi:ketosteroid isomerase-like protein
MDVEGIRKAIAEAGTKHYEAAMAGDVETLAQMIGDDVMYTHTNGIAEDKSSYLDRVARGTYRRMKTTHAADHIWVLSEDAAVVRGTTHSTTTGDGGVRMDNVEASVLDVWVKRADRWQLIAHQISMVLDEDQSRKVFAVVFRN